MSLQLKIFIVAFIGLFFYFTKTGEKVANLARGIRNNNPMNLRKSSNAWQGKTEGTDESFETFVTPEYGIRAGAKTLITYQDRYSLNTVNDIINRFAPPIENNTNAYAEHVASELGVDVNAPIDVRSHLFELVSAIIKHENGVNPYSDSTIQGGLALV